MPAAMTVLIDMPVYEPMLQKLGNLPGVNIRLPETPEEKVRPLPADLVKDCDVLFCTFPPENHEIMDRLKLVQISSVGFKQLTGQGLPARRITCCNARGVFDVPIAEWNVAMMVNLARNIRGLLHNQDNEVWDRSAVFQREIRGSIVGIWGYGGIGRETARLVKNMGMRVHVLSRNGIKPRQHIYNVAGTGDKEGILPDKVFTIQEKKTFLKDLDFLVIAMPQTSDNEGIIGEAELEMLKPGAFILNPARGPLINEQALINALQNNRIAGAALDTHYHYPMPPGHPLWQLPNVIMTPHISGSSLSPGFLERVWDIFVQNIVRWQQGEPLLNELATQELE
jgi:phosphoglycerate dehydrogenase-like enzyme